MTAEGGARQALSLVLFLLCALAFLLRFAISPQLLDRVVDYSSDSGAFYEKLHVGSYAILLVSPFVLFGQPFTLRGDEIGKFRALVRFLALLVGFIGYIGLCGHFSSAGFLVDTYVVAGVAGLMMLAQPPEVRRRLGDVTLVMLVVSALMGIFEAVTHQRLLPYDLVEVQFRPIGLSEHPLALGAFCATGIGFVAMTRWRVWLRVVAIFILLVGCAASGARFSLIMAGAELICLLLFTPWPQLSRRHARQAKAMVLLLVLVGGTALVALLFAGGLLSRFSNTIFDQNFMVRVSIYDVFGYASWHDLLVGMRSDDLIAIVQKKLHLPTIESAPVVIIMLFGIPAALFFTGLLGWLFLRMLRYAAYPTWLGTATFVLASLSNNTLSSKTPAVTIALVLMLAYARSGPGRQSRDSG